MRLPRVVQSIIATLAIIVQLTPKLKVVSARTSAGKVLKELKKVIQDNKNSLSKQKDEDCEKHNSYEDLKAIIKAQSDLCSVINRYLESKYPELETLKVIIYVDDTCIWEMEKANSYLSFKMQIQSTQNLVKSINYNKLTDANKILFASAEDLLKKPPEIHIDMGIVTLEDYLSKIKELNSDLSEIKTN
jgi:Sec-independent protein translocase protein TatA